MVIVTLIVVLAVYVSLGRMLTSLTRVYQREILQEINARVPFTIDAQAVGAGTDYLPVPVPVLQ